MCVSFIWKPCVALAYKLQFRAELKIPRVIALWAYEGLKCPCKIRIIRINCPTLKQSIFTRGGCNSARLPRFMKPENYDGPAHLVGNQCNYIRSPKELNQTELSFHIWWPYWGLVIVHSWKTLPRPAIKKYFTGKIDKNTVLIESGRYLSNSFAPCEMIYWIHNQNERNGYKISFWQKIIIIRFLLCPPNFGGVKQHKNLEIAKRWA